MLHHNEFSTFMRGYILHALNFLQECSSYTLKVVRGKFFLWTCETAITPYYKITLNPDDEKTPKNCQILILGCKWASVPCTWRFRSMKRHITCHEKKIPPKKLTPISNLMVEPTVIIFWSKQTFQTTSDGPEQRHWKTFLTLPLNS